jgi:hypothetical protein
MQHNSSLKESTESPWGRLYSYNIYGKVARDRNIYEIQLNRLHNAKYIDEISATEINKNSLKHTALQLFEL